MSMSRQNAVPRVPTPPQGDEIASYATYLEAQKAVDFLSDRKFTVEAVTIVGTDLRMVERVTGRLTYGRIATAGALSGAWFGLFVGVLMTLFTDQSGFGLVVLAIVMGAAFGLLFSVLSYAVTGGRRDFTSSSQIVASRYSILCRTELAGEARRMLSEFAGAGLTRPANPSWGTSSSQAHGLGTGPTPPGAAPTPSPAGAAPVDAARADASGPGPADGAPASVPDSRWTLPDGTPRYGAMMPTKDAPTTTPAPAPDQPNAGASQPEAQPDKS